MRRLTVRPWASRSSKPRSRVSLISRAIRSIASSQEIGVHSGAPGARYSGLVSRRSLTTNCLSEIPLEQSVPRLIGLSTSPSMCTTVGFTFCARSPRVWMTTPQPTAQYGQTLSRLRGAGDLELAGCGSGRAQVEAERGGRGGGRSRAEELSAGDLDGHGSTHPYHAGFARVKRAPAFARLRR